MVEFFKKTNFNFIGLRKKMFFVSAILILATIGSLIYYKGFNLSIDFVGGTLVQVKFENTVSADISTVRSLVSGLGYGNPEIKTLAANELQITVKKKGEGMAVSQGISAALAEGYAQNKFEILKQESVGAKVSGELARNAVMAILLSWLAIILYMWIRFKLPHGVAAVIALIHDIIITTGVFTIRDAEISLSFVAAILTVIGYSLNDTIVIFDRVRENVQKGGNNRSFEDLINTSINETLSRTVITAVSMLMALTVFYFFGGEATRDLSLAMIIGTLIGTYSSYFVACPVLVVWNKKYPIKAH